MYLIVHVMIPFYPAVLFGGSGDGNGTSFVQVFRLPDNFDPDEESVKS